MASFTTVISEFSDKENSRTYMVAGHTVAEPRLVIQKRKVATTVAASPESSLQVVYGTLDPEGNPLQSKVALSATVRFPANGESADVTAALATFRDLVASDEFTAMVNSQAYIQ
jgi:hypothetical protein